MGVTGGKDILPEVTESLADPVVIQQLGRICTSKLSPSNHKATVSQNCLVQQSLPYSGVTWKLIFECACPHILLI